MKNYIHLSMVLFIISAIACGILALVNDFTSPIIQANKIKEEELARKVVLPEAVDFTKQVLDKSSDGTELFYYTGKDSNGNIVGYTLVATAPGYSSNPKTMVGLDPELLINNIKVIDQAETPGLGANCVNDNFAPRFSGKNKAELKVDKDGGSIASITGATITTRAITNSIAKSIAKLEKALGK